MPPPREQLPRSGTDGRLLDRRAVILVGLAIALGGVMQLVAIAMSHNTSTEPAQLVRYALILTLGFYAVVALMIVSQITPSVRLRWGDGPLPQRLLIGFVAGASVSGVLLLMVSAAWGRLHPDPRIVQLVSEGDAAHIIIVVLLTSIVAPLVEETLFRGLLLESLRPRSGRLAIVVSAGAFAVWHLMPAALIYYSICGALLGAVYLKQGLAGSMAAHAAFNGVLTIAAVSLALAPAKTVGIQGFSMTAPSGWAIHQFHPGETSTNDSYNMALDGPSGSAMIVSYVPAYETVPTSVLVERLDSSEVPLPPGVSRLSAATVTQLPAGEEVSESISLDGHVGRVMYLKAPGRDYKMAFFGAGSDKAERDIDGMLESIRLS